MQTDAIPRPGGLSEQRASRSTGRCSSFHDIEKLMRAAGFSSDENGIFTRYIERRHAGEAHLSLRPDGVEIDLIFTTDAFRNQGVGAMMLRDICAIAEILGLDLFLTACQIGIFGMTQNSLVGWYARYGFAVIHDGVPRNGLRMVRRAGSVGFPHPSHA